MMYFTLYVTSITPYHDVTSDRLGEMSCGKVILIGALAATRSKSRVSKGASCN